MLEQYKQFCEKEYVMTVHYVTEGYGKYAKSISINNTIQYLLGATMFAQTVGLSFEDVDGIYNEYKEKLEGLLND